MRNADEMRKHRAGVFRDSFDAITCEGLRDLTMSIAELPPNIRRIKLDPLLLICKGVIPYLELLGYQVSTEFKVLSW